MTKLQRIQSFFSRHRIASMIVGQVVILGALGLVVLNSVFGVNLFRAFAQVSCPSGDTVYVVQSGDTLAKIAAAYGTSAERLAQDSQIADVNRIYLNQQICVPDNGTSLSGGTVQQNTTNPFPYGQCTWWAAERYKKLHGFYVPWTTNSDAWQWTARAREFGWQVSDRPSIGAIVDFQPYVQGSSYAGHVAVVEQILSNGDVVTSNMNIQGYSSGSVVNLTFHPGSGVTFITA